MSVKFLGFEIEDSFFYIAIVGTLMYCDAVYACCLWRWNGILLAATDFDAAGIRVVQITVVFLVIWEWE